LDALTETDKHAADAQSRRLLTDAMVCVVDECAVDAVDDMKMNVMLKVVKASR